MKLTSSDHRLAASQVSTPNPGTGTFNPPNYSNALNGTGTGSTVRYVPGDNQGAFIDGRLATSDTVLFHELTHARHAASGAMQTGVLAAGDAEPGPGQADIGINKEEYATVGLQAWKDDAITENAYRAERRKLLGDGAGANLYYAPRTRYNGVMS